MSFPVNSEESYNDELIDKLWGSTLKELLLAETDEEFDDTLEEFMNKRNALGYQELLEKKYKYVIEAKKKLGLD